MLIRRAVQVLALVWPIVVVGVILAFFFVPSTKTSVRQIEVPNGFTLIDFEGSDVQEVSLEELLALDLENQLIFFNREYEDQQDLVHIGIGRDTQGNSTVYKAEQSIQSVRDPGRKVGSYSVNLDDGTVLLKAKPDNAGWIIAYLLIGLGVVVVSIISWTLIHDHILPKRSKR